MLKLHYLFNQKNPKTLIFNIFDKTTYHFDRPIFTFDKTTHFIDKQHFDLSKF